MYCKYMRFSGLFVALEAYLGWNDNIHNNLQLVKLASYISKKLILDRIDDLSCDWSLIIGQQNTGSKSGIWAKNTRAMSQLPTLWDANQRYARTSMISQQKLWLCHE